MFNSTVVQPKPKRVDAIYLSQQYETWRKIVIDRAGARCQAIDNGYRCHKAAPAHRMFADHIAEISDDGATFDPANGQCLCGSHHTIKTMAARARRMGGVG